MNTFGQNYMDGNLNFMHENEKFMHEIFIPRFYYICLGFRGYAVHLTRTQYLVVPMVKGLVQFIHPITNGEI